MRLKILKNVEWQDQTQNTIVHKFDLSKTNNALNKGSTLTVREGQAVVFCDKGRLADVFLPGFYKLDTNNLPLLTKLMSWKYGFETPFKSDIYFVSTRLFTNQKWGTVNPIILRDKDYGAIRVRGFGSYSFKVDDPFVFVSVLNSTNSTYRTEDINQYLRSLVITGITDALGESKIPILDLASNLMELGKVVTSTLEEDFKSMGISLEKFNVENFSLPEGLEKALDKSTELGMMRGNMDVYTQMAAADSMREAAKNPGTGGAMGAGMGLGMGVGMGNMLGSMMQGAAQGATQKPTAANTIACSKCGAQMATNAKFCPECGTPNGISCPKCKATVAPGAKFCPECGQGLSANCPKCNAPVKPGAKFCPDCGQKL